MPPSAHPAQKHAPTDSNWRAAAFASEAFHATARRTRLSRTSAPDLRTDGSQRHRSRHRVDSPAIRRGVFKTAGARSRQATPPWPAVESRRRVAGLSGQQTSAPERQLLRPRFRKAAGLHATRLQSLRVAIAKSVNRHKTLGVEVAPNLAPRHLASMDGHVSGQRLANKG